MSKKTELTKRKKRDKIHPADQCGIYAKPKRYKKEVQTTETTFTVADDYEEYYRNDD